jgi:biotin transport system substrate-specific component
MEYAIKHKTLYESFFRQKNIFLDISMMLIAVVFLGILSNLYIPLWPVPITGQTLGIFLIAFWFGSRKGLVTLGLYTLAGIIGFSVFTQHKSGIAAITGPTGGYILGFLAAVFVVGYLIEKGYGRTKTSVLYCMILGNAIIYIIGLIGLKLYLVDVGLLKLLTLGLFPFLIGDAVKIVAAVALFPYLWKGSEKIEY